MEGERVLIVGSGAREHALTLALHNSPQVSNIWIAPGNAGTAPLGRNVDTKVTNIEGIIRAARDLRVDLVVVGPEVPLAMGLVDAGQKEGLHVFGPTQRAAQLESSKAFTARFCERYSIPQPATAIFTDPAKAIEYIATQGHENIVIKADGLCAGKGVVLPKTQQEAGLTIQSMMLGNEYGTAGRTVVIQERLVGQEVSVICLTDGQTIVPLISAKDHKRLLDHDEGPNTGGMGAVAPNPYLTRKMMTEIMRTIIQPIVSGMAQEGMPFTGGLFAGIMLTADGPKLLEVNARLGDPETQSQVMLLDRDLYPALRACTNGTLTPDMIGFRKGAAVGVVLAAEGYPKSPRRGDQIEGLNTLPTNGSVAVFHGGTTLDGAGRVVTAGGRVLTVVGIGWTRLEANHHAQEVIGADGVHFYGMQRRTDTWE